MARSVSFQTGTATRGHDQGDEVDEEGCGGGPVEMQGLRLVLWIKAPKQNRRRGRR